jgi:hypothetical protein
MDKVYARAAFTIAATASENSDGGLFYERAIDSILPRLQDIQFNTDAPWLRNKHQGIRLER